jgi:hypothetical protein
MGSLFGPPALSRMAPPRPSDGDTQAFSGDGADASIAAPTAAPAASEALVDRWPAYVRAVKDDRVHVGAHVANTQPLRVEGETLCIGVPDELHRRLLGMQESFLLEHLGALGAALPGGADSVKALRFEVHAAQGHGDAQEATSDDPSALLQALREQLPAVDLLVTKFGGELTFG